MAMPRSASLRASTSLTPSPVMATVCPRAWRAFTIACFWRGATRPKTACSSIRAPSSPGSPGRSRRPRDDWPGAGRRAATALTVRGLSPEITFSATPCAVKYAMAAATSDLSCSASRMNAAGRRPAGSDSLSRDPWVLASTRTRRPLSASVAARARCSRWPAASTTSGAPSTQVPCPSKLAALHLRAEENGTAESRAHPAGAGNAWPIAASVAFWSPSAASAPSAASTPVASSSRMTRSNVMLPSVRVPVLSKQTTSTRASTSTAGSCCSSTRRRARVTAATPKATLVSSTSPCGTMPTSAATVPVSAPATLSRACSWLTSNSTATGTIAQVT